MKYWMAMLVGIGCLWDASYVEAKAPKGTRAYIVQQGESCWSIALKIYGSGKMYKVIHKHNRLGKLPHILRPGQTIYLPGAARKADAKIEWLRRRVQARPPRSVDWRRAKKRMNLWRLYKLKTGNRSAVGIRFDNRSFLRMREQALLVIYGSSAQRVQARRIYKRTVVVERGTVRGGLGSLFGKSSMTVKTASSEIVLKSKLSQVQVDKDDTSIISVYDGHADVKAQGAKVRVPKGQGTFVKKGKKPAKPRPLPSPPKWENQSLEAVVLMPRQQVGKMTFRWKPVKNAARYRFEISRHPTFKINLANETYPIRKKKIHLPGEPLIRAVVGSGVLGFHYVGLKPGTYYARVSVLDRHKLESAPSQTLVIRVAYMKASKVLKRSTGGAFEAVGLLKFEPPKSGKQITEVSLNKGPFEAFKRAIRLSKPGRYTIRFRPRGSKQVTSRIQIRVLPVVAKFSHKSTSKLIKIKGQSTPISLLLKARYHPVFKKSFAGDKKPLSSTRSEWRAVALPGLKMTAYPGGDLPIKTIGAGRYQATLKAPTKYQNSKIVVVASWFGGELSRTTFKVQKPPMIVRPKPLVQKVEPPPTEMFDWPSFAVGMEWASNAIVMPSRAARPTSSLRFRSFLQERTRPSLTNPNQSERALFLRMSFIGELALLDQRLGLDLELPWLQMNVMEDSADHNKLGNIRAGIRYVVFRSKNLFVAPSFRLSFPTGGVQRASKAAVFEPGLLLSWRPLEWMTVHTNQMFVFEYDFSKHTGLFYSSAYGVEARFWKLSFGLELNMVLGAVLDQPFALQGIGMSGAIRLHFDRAQVGVVAGGMFDEVGQKQFGGYSIGLTFALGFRGPKIRP